MRIKVKIFIITLCLVSFMSANSNLLSAKKNVDIINEIVEQTNCNVIENGIQASVEIWVDGKEDFNYVSRNIEEKFCIDVLKLIGFANDNNAVLTVMKDESSYCLEFNRNNCMGYIESRSYDNHNIITLNITNKTNINDLTYNKNKIISAMNQVIINNQDGVKVKSIKTYEYTKAALEKQDLESYNNDIIKIMKNYNVVNIDTIKIGNGYSTVAYTKQYEKIKCNGKWVDINFAVTNYSSGSYITIGTPIINIVY